MLSILFGMIRASTAKTLPLHPGKVCISRMFLLSWLLLLSASVDVHGIWCLGISGVRGVVQGFPSFLCLMLPHMLVQDLGGLPQLCKRPYRPIRDSQVVLYGLIESIVEAGPVVGV